MDQKSKTWVLDKALAQGQKETVPLHALML